MQTSLLGKAVRYNWLGDEILGVIVAVGDVIGDDREFRMLVQAGDGHLISFSTGELRVVTDAARP